MDLKLFFTPTEVDVDTSTQSFQSSIYIKKHKMPDYTGLDIALIGLEEYRGADKEVASGSADHVRKQLYKLRRGSGSNAIIDLGNFRNGPTVEDTYARLKEVCSFLMSKEILPVIFCGSHDMDMGQYGGYASQQKLVSVLNIDQRLDMGGDIATENHIEQIFKYEPNFLFNYYHLGHQSFLSEQRDLDLLDALSFDYLRLGMVKERIKEMEPMIRNADMITIDMSALQSGYAPSAENANVYGLTGEEACQLTWYAGQNEKLSSFGIYNYDHAQDTSDRRTAFVMSTMLWYFIEGFYNRKGEKNFTTNDYTIYDVHFGHDPETIRFYKSKLSEKWWMEMPNARYKNVLNRSNIIACSYEDYQTAMKGELPDSWLNFLKKINT